MTDTLCMPRSPLKCWQYFKNSDAPLPRWAMPWLLMQDNGTLEFVWPDNGGQQELPHAAWLVLLDDGTNSEPWCAWYTSEEFERQYQL